MAAGVRVATVGEFSFEGYDWDAANAVVRFHYTLRTGDGPLGNSEHRFTEVVGFSRGHDVAERDGASAVQAVSRDTAAGVWAGAEGQTAYETLRSETALHRGLVFAGALLGISYYKTALPPVYRIVPEGLSQEALDFLAAAITQGLGELAFRAGLPGLPRPELRAPKSSTRRHGQYHGATRRRRPLVAIGGGKDSAVSVRMLHEEDISLVQVAVNPNPVIRRVMGVIPRPAIGITRRIDPLLLTLNEAGAINGHVPVTAMNSALMVVQSQLLALGPVVMSNERSSSEPTLIWNGEAVNHQWSKSLEAERMLSAAFVAQTAISGTWFSLLRPFSELRIASMFAANTEFDRDFVSCNRAFRIAGAQETWCGDCDKCRFVALILAPFMTPERLRAIFSKDMLDDETQLSGFQALFGETEQKPWECVGEVEESRVAAALVARSEAWQGSRFVRWMHREHPKIAAEAADSVSAQRVLAAQYPEPPQDLPAEYDRLRRAVR